MRNINFLLICLFLIGCSTDDTNITDDPNINVKPDPLEGLPDKGPIRFDNLAIGQRSYFVFFDAVQSLPTKEISFEYSADTLVLAITGQESGNWIMKDFLTDGSISKVPSGGGFWTSSADSVHVRYLQVDADSIYISRPPQGDFFSFAFRIFLGSKVAFPFSLVSDPAPLNPTCMPAFFPLSAGEEWMEYTLGYTQFGQTFDHLNDYFDNREMAGDGYGYMYVYSPADGIVRLSWMSYWSLDEAQGWDLVPK